MIGVFVEYGDISQSNQGKRTDLEELKDSLDSKRSLQDIANDHFGPFLKYQRGIIAYRNAMATKRTWKPHVVVYWGKTGTGKTRTVHEFCDNLYIHPGGSWFDGYDNHSQCLFDDFGGSEFKLSYLLKLLDRYPMKVPIKGGFVEWAPKEIFITSNLDPRTWFSNAHQEHVDALFRRFTFICEYQ